ncbi:hypothetical protein CsatB_029783 [Cannabis sativa]
MAKFDPWPIFFRREWKRNWPFLVGFAVTGTIITKFSLGLTGRCQEFAFCSEAQEYSAIVTSILLLVGDFCMPVPVPSLSSVDGAFSAFVLMNYNNRKRDFL